MRILFIGDIVGRPGRRALKELLPGLRDSLQADFAIANGENAAAGFGITEGVAREILDSGVDVITMGNHAWHQKESLAYYQAELRLIRPANFPPGAPGRGSGTFQAGGQRVGVINLQGRTFMQAIDCPFRAADRELEELGRQSAAVIVDMHAEATSEKMAMGWYLAGRVSAVIGTHTHVATQDLTILPGGTAYITDAGMTGPTGGVLGVSKEIVIRTFVSRLPAKFELSEGRPALSGVLVEVGSDGRATEAVKIDRLMPPEGKQAGEAEDR